MALKASILGALPLSSVVLLSIVALFLDSGRGKKLDAFVASLPLIFLAIYRVFFHPLAKYPGPFWNKITTFPIAYIAMKGDRHKYLRRLHDYYGPVVRLGPEELSYVSTTAVNRILTSAQAFDKSHVYDLHPLATETDGLFFIQDATKHRTRRRIWNRTITSSALREYRPAIVGTVEKFIARLLKDQETKGIVDAGRICAQWAFDTTNNIWFAGRAFQKQGPFLETDDLSVPTQGTSELIMFDILAYVPLLFYLTKELPFAHKYRQFEKFARATAERIMADTPEPHEGISHLINDKESPLNAKDTPFEIETILVGGSDTIHAMSTMVMYCLASQPVWVDRVREELAEASKAEDVKDVTSDIQVLEKLPIFNAFLQECLRFGQSFSGLPRTVPPGGAVIDDGYVPAGVTVSVPINAYHMDYNAFGPDARIFNPQRWLDPESGARKNPSLVFGAGHYKCVGMKVAFLELRIMLASMATKLDVELNKGFDEAVWWAGIHNWRSTEYEYPLNVHIRPR